MNHLYQEFINLKKQREYQENKDYLYYLQNLDEFHEFSFTLNDKEFKKYKRYLENLVHYLRDYFQRVHPLTDFSIVEKQINEDFEFRWKEGTIRGWESKTEDQNIKAVEPHTENSLFCKFCKQIFLNEHTYIHHQTGKKHKRNEKLAGKPEALQIVE